MLFKRVLFMCVVSALCVMLAGMASPQPGEPVDGQPYRAITASEIMQLMEQQQVYLLDVRETEEVESGMLPDAVNYPLSEFSLQMEQSDIPTDAYIVVYCGSGMRSATAARKLCNMGYQNVFDLGAMSNWPS